MHRVITGFLIEQAGLRRGAADAGSVTLIQRFGSAANLNIHLHCLVLEGVYRRTEGEPVFSVRTVAGQEEKPSKALCADAHGFSLHAAVRLASHRRKELERLCRYITRPALANERLSRNARGEVVLKLKSPYCDGTTHIVLQPQEFMQRLAALVPRPRLHLIRYHGVLAPNAKLRGAVIPQPEQRDIAPAHEHAHG
ncbi:MAG: transposase [Betaproteobacteria bacterium]